jgi:hypothetical protein
MHKAIMNLEMSRVYCECGNVDDLVATLRMYMIGGVIHAIVARHSICVDPVLLLGSITCLCVMVK